MNKKPEFQNLFFALRGKHLSRRPALAFSIRHQSGGLAISVAIPNVADVVRMGTQVDQDAALLGVELRMPGKKIKDHLLPLPLHEQVSFLQEGPFNVLEARAYITSKFEIENMRVVESTIPECVLIDVGGSGDDPVAANDDRRGSQLLKLAAVLARSLARARAKMGGRTWVDWENYRISDEEGIALPFANHNPEDVSAFFVLRELQILANIIITECASQDGLPILYRSIQKTLKGLGSKFSVDPGVHEVLAEAYYAPFAQPTERYVDLINQRQVLAHLRAEALPYSLESLKDAGSRMSDLYDKRQREKEGDYRELAASLLPLDSSADDLSDQEIRGVLQALPRGFSLPESLVLEVIERLKEESLSWPALIHVVGLGLHAPLAPALGEALVAYFQGHPRRALKVLGGLTGMKFLSKLGAVLPTGRAPYEAKVYCDILGKPGLGAKAIEVSDVGGADASIKAKLTLFFGLLGVPSDNFSLAVGAAPATDVTPQAPVPRKAPPGIRAELINWCRRGELPAPEFATTEKPGNVPGQPRFDTVVTVQTRVGAVSCEVKDSGNKKSSMDQAAFTLLAELIRKHQYKPDKALAKYFE